MDRSGRDTDPGHRGGEYLPPEYLDSHLDESFPGRQSAGYDAPYTPTARRSTNRNDIPNSSRRGGDFYMPGTPGAPKPPRQIDPRGSSRDRSRSPGRQSAAEANGPHRERPPMGPPPPPRNKFADPLLNSDKFRGRRPSQASKAYNEIEYTKGRHHRRTSPERHILDFVDHMKNLTLKPIDVPGQELKQMKPWHARNVARNTKIILAYPIASMYDGKYQGERWNDDFDQIVERAKPAVVCMGRITDQLCDDNVGIDDLERLDGIHGSSIDKDRESVMLQQAGEDAQVVSCYGFGKNDKPPGHKRLEYALFKHVDDDSDPEGAWGLPVIRFTGFDKMLTKTTYLHIARPRWIKLKRFNFAREGELVVDDIPKLADLMSLGQDRPLRQRGRELKLSDEAMLAERAARQLASQQRQEENVLEGSEGEIRQDSVDQAHEEDQTGEGAEMPGNMYLDTCCEADGDCV